MGGINDVKSGVQSFIDAGVQEIYVACSLHAPRVAAALRTKLFQRFATMSTILVTGGTGTSARSSSSVSAQPGTPSACPVAALGLRLGPALRPSGRRATWRRARVSARQWRAPTCVHAAQRRDAREGGCAGTRNLLAACKQAATPHFFYISIVGIEKIPLGYYKVNSNASA